MDPTTHRQQVLFLWLEDSSLDSRVVAWSLYDGSGDSGVDDGATDTPPYATSLDALRDGWRLLVVSSSASVDVSDGRLKHEVVLERIVPVRPGTA